MLFTALGEGRSHPESVKAGANKLVGLLCLKGVGSEGFVYTSRRLCGRDLVTASFFFSLLGQRCWSGIMSSYRFVVLLESVPLKRFFQKRKGKKKRKEKVFSN